MVVRLTVYGSPVAQGRPRFARRGNFVSTYDPAKSRNYKDLVALEAEKVKPKELLRGPLSADIVACMEIPKSWSKKKRQEALSGTLQPTSRNDCDNLAKGCLDALNGLIYVDDGQITELRVRKTYSDIPRVEIEIYKI